MIKLVKSTFYREKETRRALASFVGRAGTLSMGEECIRFEQAFAKKQGRRYAVLVANGSLANLILLQSLLNLGRLKRGDQVGISAVTWATNVMPIVQLGLTPVAIDVSLETLNINPTAAASQLKKLKALFVTNVLGLSDDLRGLRALCRRAGIILLEDNCESLGSELGGVKFGNFGLAATFSFFVGHHLSTIEGGMVVTDNKELYEMLVLVRAHGWDRNLSIPAQKKLRRAAGCDDFYAKYTFHHLAYNARPTEITGFLGQLQLKHWDEIVARRQANFKQFAAAAAANPDFLPLQHEHLSLISSMAMPIVCVSPARAEHYKKKFAPHVEIRPLIAGNITRQPFYREHVRRATACPNAEIIHRNGFYFANNPELTKQDVALIISLLGIK